MINKKISIISILVLTLGVLGYFLVSEPSKTKRNLTELDPTLASEKSKSYDFETIQEMLNYRLEKGKVYKYTFQRKVNAMMQGKSMMDIEMAGTLNVHGISRKGNKLDLLLAAEFSNLKGIGGPPEKNSAFTNIIYMQIEPNGHIVSIRFAKEMAERSRQEICLDIASNWLKILPVGQSLEPPKEKGFLSQMFNEEKFVFSSSDTHGEYIGYYQNRDRGKNPLELSYIKLKYIRGLAEISVTQSEHDFAWNISRGYPIIVNGKEKLNIGPEGLRLESIQTYGFEFAGIADSQFSLEDLSSFTENANMLADADMKVTPQGLNERAVLSYDELKARLDSLTNETPDDKKHDTFYELTRSAKKNKEVMVSALRDAAQMEPKGDSFRMVLGAASYVGSREAQSGLVNLYKSGKMDGSTQQSIVESFILMDKPFSKETSGFLQDLFQNGSEDQKTSAGLALATGLRNSPNDAIRSAIEEQWRAATTLEQKMIVIEYIGNSGDPNFFPYIQEAMNGPLELQRKAVYATRFMEEEKPIAFLFQQLATAADANIRQKAVESLALHTWKDGYFASLVSCVQRDPVSNVKIKCSNLAMNQPNFKNQMKEVLKGLVGVDSEMKTYISTALTE